MSSDFQPGRTSVAAPVLDSAEAPLGGVSIAASSDDVTPDVVRELAPRVVQLASEISRRLVDVS